MNPSLFLLIGLHLRAIFRRITRGAFSIKGLVFLILGLGFVAFVVFGQIVASNQDVQGRGFSSDGFSRYGPLVLVAFTLLSVLGSSRNRGVYFSQAEINFLFSGPFSRRQLLAYRLCHTAIQNLLSVLLLSVFMFRHFQAYWHCVVALFMTLLFLSLAQQATSLFTGILEEKIVARGRRYLLFLLVAAVIALGSGLANLGGGEVVLSDFLDWLETPLARALLAPFRVFSNMLSAPDSASFLAAATGALGVLAFLVLVIFLFDLEYREVTIATSARIHSRIQQFRRGRLSATGTRKLRVHLPYFPRWGGAGTVAWRQAQELIRESPATVTLFTVFIIVAAFPILAASNNDLPGNAILGTPLFFMLVCAPFILSNYFRFDFRGDLDRMDVLLSLPIRSTRVVLGQVLIPSLAMSALQCVGFLFVHSFSDDRLGDFAIVGMVLSLPYNFLYVCLENFFFLLYPTRMAHNSPIDFQSFGKMIVLMTSKFALIGAMVLLSLVPLALGLPHVLACGVALGLLVTFCLFALAMVGWTFRRYDVSQTPPE